MFISLLPYFVVFLFPVLSSTAPSIKSNMAPINVVLDIQNIYLPILVSLFGGFFTCQVLLASTRKYLKLPAPQSIVPLARHAKKMQNELYNDITPSIPMQIPAADDVCPLPSARFQEYSRDESAMLGGI
jgi:hypothetical protein